MNRGDVVIVDYPYSDATGRKLRPALIVQSDEKNKVLADTIVALITSQLRRTFDTHVVIDILTDEGKQSGLRLPSAVQCENLYTIDQKLVLKSIWNARVADNAARRRMPEASARALGRNTT